MKVEDERFAHIKKDPRFKKVGKEKKKVKIDNRFKHMFTAPEFASVDFLDQRGRKEKQVTREKLERFYELSSGEEDEEDVKEEEAQSEEVAKSKKKKKDVIQPPPEPSSSEDEESEDEEEEKKEEDEMSDSSDGESTDEEEMPADEAIDAWDEVNTCTETTSVATYRVSICNLNWDRMNATDIFVLCNSSLHDSTGRVDKVEVFPSQYGKEQLAKERERGPDVGKSEKKKVVEEEEEEEEEDKDDDKEYSNETLRKYQIDRLKYYYAIVACDSARTADALYHELDGVEYQLSSSVLDLRFVPDDMEFDDDPPTSVCISMPDMTSYKPPTFITTALQNSSVKLTWDETDQSRLQLTTKKFSAADLETVDFSAYIASSESEDGDEDNEDGGDSKTRSLEKYKALLAGLEEEEGEGEVDQEMEITWTTGLEGNDQVVEEADKNEKRQESATLYEPDEKDDFFATDTVIDRPKPKKKKKKKGEDTDLTSEQKELALLMEGENDDRQHFNMKKIVKSGKGDDFAVDLEDDRFAAIKTSHHYAIDPSAPEYRDTSETQKLRVTQAASLAETEQRHSVAERHGEKDAKDPVEKDPGSQDIMIEKIKNRTKQFQAKKESSKIFKTKKKGGPPEKQSEMERTGSNESNQLKTGKKKRKHDPKDNAPESSKELKKSKKKKLKT